MQPYLLFRRFVVAVTLLFFATCDAAPPVSCHRVAQPAKTPCDVNGTLKNGGSAYDLYADPGVATSVNDCRNQCIRRGVSGAIINCEMFAYNATSGVCTLFNDDAQRIIKKDSSSDTVFYSHKCFKCAAQACPATPDPNTNLLDNGGFEDSDTLVGPWKVHANASDPVQTQGIHPEQPGIRSRNAVHVQPDYIYDQDYRQCAGQTHRAEFDLYNVTANSKSIPEFIVGNYGLGSFSTPLKNPPSRPARKVVGFYSATGNSANIELSALTFNSGASLNFDNAAVRPVNYSMAKPIGDEKVINGGFEMGTKPWKYTAIAVTKKVGKFSLVQPGLGGTAHALRWRQTNPNYPVNRLTFTPKIQTGSVRPGTLHRFRFKTKPILNLGLFFKDGTSIYGSSAHDQYFYAERGMFPLVIEIFEFNNPRLVLLSEVIVDECSIHEIEDEG